MSSLWWGWEDHKHLDQLLNEIVFRAIEMRRAAQKQLDMEQSMQCNGVAKDQHLLNLYGDNHHQGMNDRWQAWQAFEDVAVWANISHGLPVQSLTEIHLMSFKHNRLLKMLQCEQNISQSWWQTSFSEVSKWHHGILLKMVQWRQNIFHWTQVIHCLSSLNSKVTSWQGWKDLI